MPPRVTDHTITVLEGFEWNNVRNTLLTLARPRAEAAAEQGPLFLLLGSLNRQDKAIVTTSRRLDGVPMPQTPADPSSPYAVVFLAQDGSELTRLPFSVQLHSE